MPISATITFTRNQQIQTFAEQVRRLAVACPGAIRQQLVKLVGNDGADFFGQTCLRVRWPWFRLPPFEVCEAQTNLRLGAMLHSELSRLLLVQLLGNTQPVSGDHRMPKSTQTGVAHRSFGPVV